MLIVTGRIEIAKKDLERARAAMVEMMEATQAEEGCFTYEFAELAGRPGRFRLYEEWADRAALEAHFAMPHMARFREVLGTVEVIRREIEVISGGHREPLG